MYGRRVGLRVESLVVDRHDPERLARFWSDALGWPITDQSDEEWVVRAPEGDAGTGAVPELLFGRNPDRKVVKNRLHLDLRPRDQAAEVERLIALGARHADIGQGDDVPWVVLADPEGNEFCVLKAPNASG
jgi:predicted enzyme related to lactoylglutathione lyase